MTEFKRTSQAVDDIERLVQIVLDSSSDEEAQRLSKLVGETGPVVEKIRRKATDTDLFGPTMKERVQALVARWGPIEGLARDVLQQRGIEVVAVPAGLAAPPPAPPPQPATALFHRATPPGGAPARSAAAAPYAPPPAPGGAARGAALGPAGGPAAGGGPAAASAAERREQMARAAEARAAGRAAGAASAASAASASSSSAAPAPAPAPAPRGRAEEAAGPSPMQVDEVAAQAAEAAGPPVAAMPDLVRLVHGVFVGHGFAVPDEHAARAQTAGQGPIRVRYTHSTRDSTPIVVSYVPVQRHLVIYAVLDDPGSPNAMSRATVQLGMAATSVQAKVEYLVVYPLVHRQCVPAIGSLPPEVCFRVMEGLALPGLAALGATSKMFARAVFDDDLLWWQIIQALPPSEPLDAAVAKAVEGQRGQLPASTCRALARDEVQRCRAEAEAKRRRREEAARLEEEMRQRFMREGPPRGLRGPPGRFPGLGGNGIIGGDHDLFPGGLGFGPMGGGRRPFGGGGPGFGGGGFIG